MASDLQDEPPARVAPDWLFNVVIGLGLTLATLVVYAQVLNFDFIDYDDSIYVYNNAYVRSGLTPASIKWAFTGVVAGNRMPVTQLSHILDVQLFGLHSGIHHLENVVLHIGAALLLFAALLRATHARWPSAFAAFIFALHPLHVGSVAWIAERKDVLCACFWFLALYCYVRYAERPNPTLRDGRYLLVLGLFGLGLLAKPMMVTFPFALLLFDFWPLRRVRWPKILWEKVPMIALSAVWSVVTYRVQDATQSVKSIPLGLRVENVLISYVIYLRQTFWPERLAVFYPYPHAIPAWQALAAFILIAGVLTLVVLVWRARPYLAVGWFWYLGTLVPVIGLVQAGEQGHSDRYTYIPMVGLTLMLAWGALDAVGKWPRMRPAIVSAAAISCVLCMVFAWKEIGYWQNSETLFQRAIDVTETSWQIQSYMGEYLMKMPTRRTEAIPYLETALRLRPDLPDVSNNLGAGLFGLGLYSSAIPHFQAVLRAAPNSPIANYNLGMCMLNIGRNPEAVGYFEASLRVRPDDPNVRLNLGRALAKISGREPEAIVQFKAALRLRPEDAGAHRSLGTLLIGMGRTEEGLGQLEAAQRIEVDPETEKTIEGLKAKHQ